MISAFTLLTAATEAGSKTNEDGYGLWPPEAPRAAWVLDGVTGINDRALLPGPSDAAWFVAQVQKALPTLLSQSPDMPIGELVGALVHEMERRQAESWIDPRGADGWETPAASFALVRLLGADIEIARLGDCLVLLEGADGAVSVMDHPVLDQIEAETRRAILDLRAAGMTDRRRLFERMTPMLRAQRRRRNRNDGYGVLAAEQDCIAMVHVNRIPLQALRSVLLASDGYYRLVDHYGAMTDAELVRHTRARGADALLEQLRAIEAGDPLSAAYPRLKCRDDATALLICVGQGKR
ncbi:protein phosphatase 2C domain-containing protein [Dongia deserti]|uniref:protein phosphatase 2C domain-containing protein n=1 Tax=Dongia deserti TaxID=2268030 RepID=UPI000E648EA0|nr:protein phosphatase 2C domain-containing protein [Dongia deserti]